MQMFSRTIISVGAFCQRQKSQGKRDFKGRKNGKTKGRNLEFYQEQKFLSLFPFLPNALKAQHFR